MISTTWKVRRTAVDEEGRKGGDKRLRNTLVGQGATALFELETIGCERQADALRLRLVFAESRGGGRPVFLRSLPSPGLVVRIVGFITAPVARSRKIT